MNFLLDYVGRAAQSAANAGIDWGKSAAQAGWGATKQLAERAAARSSRRQTLRGTRASATTHPDKRDGQFMGADCPSTHAARPAAGTKPDGCGCGKGGQPLPKVMFTNGINNTPEVVCKTMHALANRRCVEVTGVFNATYQDPSLQTPVRDWAAYEKTAYDGAAKALRSALCDGAPAAALGAAGADIALSEAGRSGLVGDIVDCIDTINQGGAEAAARTLVKEIVTALNGNPPQMTIHAHNQGGLNAGAAIARAKRQLQLDEQLRLMRSGLTEQDAKPAALRYAEQKLTGLEVNSFGTLERGLPDGPMYNRFTNELDHVPKVIREAQRGLTPELVTNDPIGAPPRQTSSSAPSMNPMSAHGMNETYIPWLDEHRPQGPCC